MPNLRPCPGCSNPISQLAHACPKCGYQFAKSPESTGDAKEQGKKASYIRAGIFIVVTFAVLIPLGGRLTTWANNKRVEVPEPPFRDQVAVARQSEYGALWPLTVPEINLICRTDPARPGASDLLAKASEKTYALTWQPSKGGSAWKNISDIWRDDPATGTKISLQPLIEKAEALCRTPRS